MPTFPAAELTAFCRSLFVAGGVPAEDAQTVAHSLVLANLCGHDSHGIIRVPQYLDAITSGRLFAQAEFTVLTETPAVLSADGHWGLGQVQAYRLLHRLFDKVVGLGVVSGTLQHVGHTGRLGEYAEAAAERGLLLIAAVNSHGSGPRVAPPGGTAGRLSTNPICMGAPTPTGPLVLDIGTSVVAEGKVRVAFQKGERLPEGWILDRHGKPSTDPADLYTDPPGTLLPLGGPQAYKGFGLSMMIDLLTGGLSGGGCTQGGSPPPIGNTLLFIVLDPKAFAGGSCFADTAGALCDWVRSSPTAEGVAAIQLPGDPERAARNQRERTGIPLPEKTWQMLVERATALGVAVPTAST